MTYTPKKGTTKDETRLHDYLFHYNSITREWSAIPREEFLSYWNGLEEKTDNKILTSPSISHLILDITHVKD